MKNEFPCTESCSCKLKAAATGFSLMKMIVQWWRKKLRSIEQDEDCVGSDMALESE